MSNADGGADRRHAAGSSMVRTSHASSTHALPATVTRCTVAGWMQPARPVRHRIAATIIRTSHETSHSVSVPHAMRPMRSGYQGRRALPMHAMGRMRTGPARIGDRRAHVPRSISPPGSRNARAFSVTASGKAAASPDANAVSHPSRGTYIPSNPFLKIRSAPQLRAPKLPPMHGSPVWMPTIGSSTASFRPSLSESAPPGFGLVPTTDLAPAFRTLV